MESFRISYIYITIFSVEQYLSRQFSPQKRSLYTAPFLSFPLPEPIRFHLLTYFEKYPLIPVTLYSQVFLSKPFQSELKVSLTKPWNCLLVIFIKNPSPTPCKTSAGHKTPPFYISYPQSTIPSGYNNSGYSWFSSDTGNHTGSRASFP